MTNHWPALSAWLIEQFLVDGAHLHFGAIHLHPGKSGEVLTLAVLESWLASLPGKLVSNTDNLARQTGTLANPDIAGALALRIDIPGQGEMHLYLTRQEHVHDVTGVAIRTNPATAATAGSTSHRAVPSRSGSKSGRSTAAPGTVGTGCWRSSCASSSKRR